MFAAGKDNTWWRSNCGSCAVRSAVAPFLQTAARRLCALVGRRTSQAERGPVRGAGAELARAGRARLAGADLDPGEIKALIGAPVPQSLRCRPIMEMLRSHGSANQVRPGALLERDEEKVTGWVKARGRRWKHRGGARAFIVLRARPDSGCAPPPPAPGPDAGTTC